MIARRVLLLAALAIALLGSPGVATAQPVTERISVSSSGEQQNAVGSWWYLAPKVAFSRDGNLVAFSSDATNLVPRDRNRASDVFVRDRATGVTERVSLTSSGREANDLSFGPALSADGRYVAFLSEARNLPGIRRGERGRFVFVRDRQAGTTVRADVSSSGEGGRGGAWGPPAISADGRFVAFTSDAPNLAAGDADAYADVFVHDLRTGETTGVSGEPNASEAYDFSVAAAISADGRFVLLVSESPLAPGAEGDASHVFLHDRQERTTILLGRSGADVFDGSRGAISDDGSVAAFEQRTTERSGVVVWQRSTRSTACVACWNGRGTATWDTLSGMSSDGRRVAFARDEGRGRRQTTSVFVRDLVAGALERVSIGHGGARPNGRSGIGGLSPDGRFAAFSSAASNLVPGDTNRRTDLFVRGPLW